jgi:ParB/RepB/Spo0J family partition protein
MKTISLHVADIEIGERRRALSEDAVKRLAASMKDIGLQQPIAVRIVEEMMVGGHLTAGVPVLVAGHHRLAAAKALGWADIDCVEIDDDAITAELWEIAENLHRLDLTKEQRDEHIRRYAELLTERAKVAQPATLSQPVTGRGNKGVARQVADATGLSKDTVRRALNPKPAPEPKSPLADHDVFTVQFNALMAAWNRAGPDVREAFLTEIDSPVFDNTRSAT